MLNHEKVDMVYLESVYSVENWIIQIVSNLWLNFGL